MLVGSLIFLSILCIIQIFVNAKLAKTVFNFEDNTEHALDEIDKAYQVVSEILSRPLFYDSPEVREIHRQIGFVNITLLSIANNISNIKEEDSEEEE